MVCAPNLPVTWAFRSWVAAPSYPVARWVGVAPPGPRMSKPSGVSSRPVAVPATPVSPYCQKSAPVASCTSTITTGPSQVAAHTPVSYLGGWEPLKPLPTVLMAARKGVASSVVTFLAPYLFADNSRPSCPRGDRRFWFRSLWVNVPGGTRPFVLDVSSMIVCAYFVATPIARRHWERVVSRSPGVWWLTAGLWARCLAASLGQGLASDLRP